MQKLPPGDRRAVVGRSAVVAAHNHRRRGGRVGLLKFRPCSELSGISSYCVGELTFARPPSSNFSFALFLDPSEMIPGDSSVSLQPSSSNMPTAMPAEGSQFASVQGTPEGEHERLAPPSSLQQQQQQQAICSPLPPPQQLNGVYPPALASHEGVVADRDLFYDTLNKFHASLGTRLSIPTIGGKELDLHLLYVEVSSRGGLEQVIRERKWKEVTVVFHFPPTTTSASFVLRKYYVSLLHHYEQVYFFGTQGPLVAPLISASIPSQSPGQQSVDNGSMINGEAENGELVIKKRKRRIEDSPQLNEADFAVPIGHAVSGVIDGKFERGYLVTVSVGTEKLRGILYHLPLENVTPQFASVSEMAKGVVMDSVPEVRRRRRRRRKDEMPKKDPNAPKPNRSGYNFFFQEHRKRLKALHPDKDKELSKMIGELWNKQTEEERAVYQERGIKDKERYKKEMETYRGSLKVQSCVNNGAREAHIDGGGIVLPTSDATRRPEHSMSSLSETDSLHRVEEEKPKSDVGTL
ncbi:hypothetical protein GOP47_0006410 [Adiantum capillus-veneris]|uniref:Uncharacterized protein n=1 Tax=Adiantum capillus-veneris TaxID=13818 RepID=A0A9D4V379_ADICA|nr:hypothetical protein GOP47_0006410 [Adiantum capillus-veneris]